jgi:hypothetical protein
MVDQRFASGTFGFTEQFFVGLLQVSFSGFRVVLDREVTWLIGVLANRCHG